MLLIFGFEETPPWYVTILIYVLGLSLFLVEVFVPSFLILTVAGLLCVSYSLWTLFSEGYVTLGILAVLLTIAYIYGTIRWGLPRFTHSQDLGPTTLPSQLEEAESSLLQATGVTLTSLHPAGTALLDGERRDVVSSGAFLDKGTPVKVIQVSGNRIVVTRLSDAGSTPAAASQADSS